MFSLNRVDIIGYQTQPLTLRKTPGGTSVVDLNLVSPTSFRTAAGETVPGKSFHTVTLWGAMADIAGQYVRPGAHVYASGRLQTDSWEDQETKEKRSKTKIVGLDMILLDPKDGQGTPPAGVPALLSSANRAQVIGNVTRDPEVRSTTSGQKVLSMGVATNERWKDKASGEAKERTEFHNIVVWGELADQVERAVKKGARIFVSGRVQTRGWETQTGQKRTTTEIVADQVLLLGIKNSDAAAAIQPMGVSTSTSSQTSSAPSVSDETSVATEIPPLTYESDIKPEDLPF